MTTLPAQYAWLSNEPAPKILIEMLKLYGIHEGVGDADNPIILAWAKEIGLDKLYKHDETAWCGLAMAVCAQRAGYKVIPSPLWALSWAVFGDKVIDPMLGDLLVFKRFNANGKLIGGHITLYIGEDKSGYYHCLGGNQSDSISIARINKNRLYAARRCHWATAQPPNIRKIELAANGIITTNEV